MEKDSFYNAHVHIICGQSLNPIMLEDDLVMCGVDSAAAIFVMTDKTSAEPEIMDADTMYVSLYNCEVTVTPCTGHWTHWLYLFIHVFVN